MNANIDLQALVAAAGDAIVVCDAKGAITLWNAAAGRIFGFTEAEALGASLDIIIPEKQRKAHWDGYFHTMETGITRYGADVLRVPAIDKHGRALSISFTVAMLFAADGKVCAIAAIMRDETRKFQADRALRKRLAELEAMVKAGADAASAAEVQPAAGGGCPVKG
jgi:PAS domain S-box-containing protein